jgi:hypothetical protein
MVSDPKDFRFESSTQPLSPDALEIDIPLEDLSGTSECMETQGALS